MRELSQGVRILQPEDFRRMPWKNGQGMTTEIAVFPPDSGLDGEPFDWRVSIAEVQNNCEFSRFPGYDRSLMLIEGVGIDLSFDSAPSQRIDKLHVPTDFKGESQTYCHLLNGPVHDFNVMSRREIYKHVCEVFSSSGPVHLEPHSECMLFYCLDGIFNLEGLQQKQVEMNKGHALVLDKRADLPAIKNLKISTASKDMVMVFVTISWL